jgi:organic radical activating enzyme
MSEHVFPPPLERAYRVVDGKLATRSLEAHVVDHCNLTCAACCSLSPMLPRWFMPVSDLARDLERAARALAPRVFKLVGGEPLLHPELVELAHVARRSGIAPRISVTTNGLLLERAPDALFDAIDALTISLYPRPALAAESIAAITERAARFGVALNWKKQDEFVVMDRAARCEDAAETAAIYGDCWLRERCNVVRDGRFYACTRPPHFATLQREERARRPRARPTAQGRAPLPLLDPETPDLTEDGVALDDAPDLRERILAYLVRPEPLETCAYCHGGSARTEPHRLLTRAERDRARA